MIIGLNLLDIARGAINSMYPDISVTLYRNMGQSIGPDGAMHPIYAEGIAVLAQMQSEGGDVLYHAGRVGQEEAGRKFYLNSAHDNATRVAGIVRPLSRGGDMFSFADGTWWLVNAVLEDFTLAGWVCVRATLQINPPDFSSSDWRPKSMPGSVS